MKYILIDMDGTICDSARGILNSVRYALGCLEIEPPDFDTLRAFLGPPIRESCRKLFGLEGERLELAVAKYREHYIPVGMYENDLYPGSAELLRDLKSDGRKIALATGKVGAQAETILEHFGLLRYFDFVSGCELDGRRSHKHEIIDWALENMGALGDKKSAVMVGDRWHDIAGAAKAGVASVGVLYGYGAPEEFAGGIDGVPPADYTAASVAELRGILL